MSDYSFICTIIGMAGTMVPVIFVTHFVWRKKKDWRLACVWLCLFPISGIIGACLHAAAEVRSPVAQLLEQSDEQTISVQLRGTVEKVEQKQSVCVYLSGCVASGDWDLPEETQYINGVVAYLEEVPRIGSRIQAEGMLTLFRQARNPGEFDAREYYHNLGYDFCLYADSWSPVSGRYDWLRDTLYRLRQKAGEGLQKLCDQPEYGIYLAVMLGDRGQLETQVRDLFQEQGIAHILSVSGLHISAIGMLFYGGIRWISGSPIIGGVIGGLFVFLYGILTGNAVSTIRAVIMFLSMTAGTARGRIYDMPTAAAVSALLILLFHPLYLHLPAMQLSFGAILGLSLTSDIWMRFLQKPSPGMKRILGMLGLQTAMLPVTVWLYYQYAAYSLFLNPIVLPFAIVLILSPAAAVLLNLISEMAAKYCLMPGNFVIRCYELLCGLFQRLPGAVQRTGQPSLLKVSIYGMGLLLTAVLSRLAEEKRKRRMPLFSKGRQRAEQLLILLLASGYLMFGSSYLRADRPDVLTITMLDVGQGDCVLIETPEHITILSDAGSTSQKELREYLIEPVLLKKGIRQLDYVILSHGDADHINGILQLLSGSWVEIGTLLVPAVREEQGLLEEVILLAKNQEIPVIELMRGDSFSLGALEASILSPTAGMDPADSNACSLTWLLSMGQFRMLFTGDLPIEQEALLTGCQPITVLKVSHHGSRDGTSEALLSSLKPQAALISCGVKNSYGHPHREVLEALQQTGTKIYRTDRSGGITIRVKNDHVQIDTYLQ